MLWAGSTSTFIYFKLNLFNEQLVLLKIQVLAENKLKFRLSSGSAFSLVSC